MNHRLEFDNFLIHDGIKQAGRVAGQEGLRFFPGNFRRLFDPDQFGQSLHEDLLWRKREETAQVATDLQNGLRLICRQNEHGAVGLDQPDTVDGFSLAAR